MKNMKKLICALLASLMLVCVPVDGYVQGATAVATATAWEIMQTLLLSLGITVMVADSALGETISEKIVKVYNDWATSKGMEDSKLEDDVTALVGGSSRTAVVPEQTWAGLKVWSKDIAKYKDAYEDGKEDENVGTGTSLLESATQGYKALKTVKFTDSYTISDWAKEMGYKYLNSTYFDVIAYCPVAFYYTDYQWSRWMLDESKISCNAEKMCEVVSETYQISYMLVSNGKTSSRNYFKGKSMSLGETGGVAGTLACIVMPGIGVTYYEPTISVPFPKDDALSYDVAPGAGTAVKNGTWDIVTKGRTWDGETLSGDVAISIPQDIAADVSNVIAGTDTVSGVLEKVDALPVDTSEDRVIDYPAVDIPGALDYVGSKDTEVDLDVQAPPIADIKPGGSDYYIKGLETVFPFCLPFDVIDFLSVLSAPAKAPCFTVPIKYPTRNGMTTYNMKIDLSQFDSVAKILRTAETLLFCVGLASATRSLYIRG